MAEQGEHSGAKKVQPPNPKISSWDLSFLVNVETKANKLRLVKPSMELELGSHDPFKIQIENLNHLGVSKSDMNDVNIKFEVNYKEDSDDSDTVTIFDAQRSLDSKLGWLVNGLLAPRYLIRSGLVADVKVSFNGDLLDTIGLEICTEQDRRYYSLDDTLRYLQCFFLN